MSKTRGSYWEDTARTIQAAAVKGQPPAEWDRLIREAKEREFDPLVGHFDRSFPNKKWYKVRKEYVNTAYVMQGGSLAKPEREPIPEAEGQTKLF